MDITNMLAHTDKESFIGMLDDWSERWTSFMGNAAWVSVPERRLTRTSASGVHTRGLRRNMPWLCTHYDYPELHIPNTNNALEGVFTDIKTKLRVHSGISKQRRIAMIQELIARRY